MILCDRPCSNKSEYGYCNTTYCINPAIPNIAVGYFQPPQTIKTNADRIRSMTDEELAELFDNTCIENIGEVRCGSYRRCYDCMLNWLKEEVKDGN